MDSGNPKTGDSSRTISSPSGETFTFLEPSPHAGDRTLISLEVAPGTVVPLHSHDRLEETYELLEGELELVVDGRPADLGNGPINISPGHVHGFRNTSARASVLRVSGKPAQEMEYFIRMVVHLGQDGYIPVRPGARPRRPLVAAVFLHRSGQYLAPLPRVAFRALIAVLGAVGRWTGHERLLQNRYADYGRFMEARRAR